MDKAAIKKFAVWARNKLIQDISYKAGLMGITENGIAEKLPQSATDAEFYDIGLKQPHVISGEAIQQRNCLADLIQQTMAGSDYQVAYYSVIEEVAYTWFNRLIAVRFMEVNDYLPSHIRVLSSDNAAKLEPDIVTTPFDAGLSFTQTEQEKILCLKNDNKVDALFRLLFIKQCNALHLLLPKLFEKTEDYSELLLNVSVTDPDGVVYHLVHDINEDDFNVKKGGQVEIIGWLYQYYNIEPKAEVDAYVKRGRKVSKNDIPAKTQLFTPDWIVRYMVENSLGRLWIEGHPNNELKSGWRYYLDEAEQEADVQVQLDKIREQYKTIKPEDIKIMDPCMGSGHILVYAFDILMQIYETMGYNRRDAAKSILENNLYGLDIDDRAFQLTYFAIMMKARQYNRRILNGNTVCHVYSIQESNMIDRSQLKYFGIKLGDLERHAAREQMNQLLDTFVDAKEYGSILHVEKYDWNLLRQFVELNSETGPMELDFAGVGTMQTQMQQLIDMGQIMAQRYDVVVTNPPYMGNKAMDAKLSEFVKRNYPDSKMDLFAVFIEQCKNMTNINRYTAMITQHSWMFISSFEKLRSELLSSTDIIAMAHLGARAFDEIGGEVVQTTSFINCKTYIKDYAGVYVRLVNIAGENEKKEIFLEGGNRYITKQCHFSKIPGSPIAYWVQKQIIENFVKYSLVGSIAYVKKGMFTGENDIFFRLWYEVQYDSIDFNVRNHLDVLEKHYVPMNSGGRFRRWYGNRLSIIKFDKQHFNMITKNKGHRNQQFYFQKTASWTKITTGKFSIRLSEIGFINNDASMAVFEKKEPLELVVGFLNGKVAQYYLNLFNESLNYTSGNIASIPYHVIKKEGIVQFIYKCISISKSDWDSFEISWDFLVHPLVKYRDYSVNIENREVISRECLGLVNSFKTWQTICNNQFDTLKTNEEELNRIFIEIYGLQDALTPDVADKDVTVARIYDTKEDIPESMKGNGYVLTKQDVIKSLIFYAVGCMFGRYSLDKQGLVFAGGNFDQVYWKYKGQAALNKNGESITGGYAGISMAQYHYPAFRDSDDWRTATKLTFEPDVDNIIPITDEAYFEDDIVGLFCAWLKKVYGEETLEENLSFIAQALGCRGNTNREVIRNYFLKDFFNDHCKTYKKRPIYWLFDSGKNNGFKALIYMHRYDENTIGNVRIDYLHRIEQIYEGEIKRMQDTIDNGTDAHEVTAAEKQKEKLQKQQNECKEYDEKIAHLALARISIDLDDGVKVNYEKVQTGKDEKQYQILAKI
jgi:hypothetical protein